jgi:AcrR family transcriptional regulator
MADGELIGFPQAARRLLRDTLLDAVGHLLAERSWAQITMAEVARTAGVSRQTLYNELGAREALAQAYVLREADRFLADVETTIAARVADPPAALAAALEGFLVTAAEHPLLRSVMSSDGQDGLLALLTTQGRPVVEPATARLAEIVAATWPVVSPAEVRPLADLLVRVAISYAALPPAPPSVIARNAKAMLRPYIEELLEQAGGRAASAG